MAVPLIYLVPFVPVVSTEECKSENEIIHGEIES